MKKKARAIGEVSLSSLSALEDAWQRQATAAAITAARGIVKLDGPIPPGTPIGRLTDSEWGWIVAAVLFAWIKTRAQQAIAESLNTDATIRLIALDPAPWDCGAIESILGELADCSGIDWSLPLGQWPREAVVDFLCKALSLVRKATIARDLISRGVTRDSSASVIARQTTAAAGGPLLTPDDDEIPF
jgi:hypothetical protein